MRNAGPRRGAARYEQVGARIVPQDAPNLHDRFTTWRYTLRDKPGVLVMIASEKLTLGEATHSLRQHYGDRLLTVQGGAA